MQISIGRLKSLRILSPAGFDILTRQIVALRSAFSIALIANAIPVISVLYIAEKTLVVDFFFDIQALYRAIVAVEVVL